MEEETSAHLQETWQYEEEYHDQGRAANFYT
jgi:hypothetical protein